MCVCVCVEQRNDAPGAEIGGHTPHTPSGTRKFAQFLDELRSPRLAVNHVLACVVFYVGRLGRLIAESTRALESSVQLLRGYGWAMLACP